MTVLPAGRLDSSPARLSASSPRRANPKSVILTMPPSPACLHRRLHEQVRRFDVAVNDAQGVGVFQSQRSLPREFTSLADGQRPQVADEGGEVWPVDEFEHQVATVVGLVGVECGDNMRVDEPGRRPHLALKQLPRSFGPRRWAASTLRATTRRMVACSALKTRPMPPRPISSRMRYWPRMNPFVRPANKCSA